MEINILGHTFEEDDICAIQILRVDERRFSGDYRINVITKDAMWEEIYKTRSFRRVSKTMYNIMCFEVTGRLRRRLASDREADLVYDMDDFEGFSSAPDALDKNYSHIYIHLKNDITLPVAMVCTEDLEEELKFERYYFTRRYMRRNLPGEEDLLAYLEKLESEKNELAPI